MKRDERDPVPTLQRFSGLISDFPLGHVYPAHYLIYSTICAAEALPEKEANLPSREVTEIAVPLLHANVPPGKEPSLSLLCRQIEEPPRLGSRSVPSPASRLR